MQSPIFKLSIVIFLFLEIISCQIKKEVLKPHQEDDRKEKTVKLDFEILINEISLDEIKKIEDFRKKINVYLDLEIIATLKQINKTTENIEFDRFVTYENFEITNTQKENKNILIGFYDYTPVFTPETSEEMYQIKYTKPDEYSIDSINLVDNFNFYLSNSDTLLIRVKKQYLEKEIFSNWDTLIIK